MRQLVEHSFDGILTTDVKGRITSFNRSAGKMFGCLSEEAVGRDVGQMLVRDPAFRSSMTVSDLLTMPGGPHDLLGVRCDGSQFPINVVVSEMRNDDERVFIAIVRDISARRSAEAEALRTSKRLHEAVESISEGFVLYDADDRMVLCNSRYKAHLGGVDGLLTVGWRFEEALRSILAQGLVQAPDGDIETWFARRLALHRDPQGPFEMALTNGTHLMVSERKTGEGGVVATYTDITELKQREERLEQATRDAEASSRSKSEFLANMSHELRTPLNAIIGFSEIIAGEAMGPVGVDHYKDYANDIVDSGKHLLGIVNDILDVSRIEAGEYKLNEEEIDLCEVSRSCVRLVHQRAEAAGHELVADLPRDPHVVVADERSVKQVLINLLGNAIKFTPEGGRISVEIGVRVSGLVEVAVADNGIGIAEEDIPKALAFFGQADSKLARAYEGTGLGLPLARHLIEMHDGELTLDSVLGQGTRVSVSFPLERIVDVPPRESNALAG